MMTRKCIALIMTLILCLTLVQPIAAMAEDSDISGKTETDEAADAVSPAFQVKKLTDLNNAGKLRKSAGMGSVSFSENEGTPGLYIQGLAGELNTGRIIIANEYDFDERPEGRRTDVSPVGRISVDGLSDKKIKATVNVYLDDETEPRASMLLRKQMGSSGWSRDGNMTADVLAQNITGRHKVSLGFRIEGIEPGKRTTLLIRSLTFCESSVPVMYFNLDESDGSIDAMNASDDHSAECYGSVTLQVPEGYKSEFSDKVQTTSENMELEYIRGRGNSTWDMDKKPYKVKFDKKQNLLGMGKNKHWVLLANRYDNSLLRNRVTYWIVRYLGVEFAIKCTPVDVVMNGRYFGSYLLSEQVRVGENRVEIDELDDSVKDPDSLEISGGYLLNLSGYDEDDESSFTTENGGFFSIENPDLREYRSEDARKAQFRYIAQYTQSVEDAIFGNDCKDKYGRHYSTLLDEDSAVDYWWIQEFSINGDAYSGGSNYLYKKRDVKNTDGSVQPEKLYWGPLWDFDYVAWGNPNSDPDKYEDFNNTNHEWMTRLRSNDEFCRRLKARWSEPAGDAENRYSTHLSDAIEEVVKEGGVIDQYYDQIRVSEYYDNVKWGFYNSGGGGYSYGDEDEPEDEPDDEQIDPDQTFESEVEQLRNWIKLRASWVGDNIQEIGVPSYKIRFLIKGKELESRTYTEDSEFGELPKAPARDGYTFIGWFDENGYEATKETTADYDMDFFGKYVKTSKLKKAKNVYFSEYDVYSWFTGYEEEDTYSPEYVLMPEDSAPETIKWSVSDPETAVVDEDGNVKINKPGTVTVTAKLSSGVKNSYRLTFLSDEEEMQDVERLTLNRSSISLKTGAYTQLRADKRPKPHYTSYTDWFTTDPDVISISDMGIIKAKRPGSTIVVAIDSESRKYAVCKVTVTASRAYAKSAKVKGVKAKAVRSGKKRSVKVSWKKVPGVSGYYVLRSTKKTGKYSKAGTVRKAKTARWTDRKVVRGKTYYYKIQPYTKISGKTYKGKKSAAAKVKVK
ncbi:MAG: CotH kinase family protein [Eubacterium sp.]|nr:CotH kinase family protein [Eubacterium sp.]